jgi:hypothetical protein
MVNWPNFDDPLLQEIAIAFLKRRKAITYHSSLSCEREFSETAIGTFERLNLNVGNLRLCIWSDGVIWLAVCVPGFGRNAGWAFKDTFYGLVKDVSADSIVGMVESTLAIPFGMDQAQEQHQLRTIWMRVHPYV